MNHVTPTQGGIAHEIGNIEAWYCLCGNEPHEDGFYPCNKDGVEVEPTAAEWKDGLYVCNRCKRIIDPETLAVIGTAKAPA